MMLTSDWTRSGNTWYYGATASTKKYYMVKRVKKGSKEYFRAFEVENAGYSQPFARSHDLKDIKTIVEVTAKLG